MILTNAFSTFMMQFGEYIGYFASGLCAVSLMMRDVKKLRWLNMIASAIFVVYSIFKGAYPLFVTNAMIVLIDIYHIVKIRKEENR
jgi:hypothetical protein